MKKFRELKQKKEQLDRELLERNQTHVEYI
jgi:hypothetical protein